MSFKSFLSAVGAAFHKGIDWIIAKGPGIINAAQNVESLSMPFLNLLMPGLATEIDAVSKTIFAAVLSVEQKFAAMGQQSGTGAQKAAEVISIVGPVAMQTLAKFNLPADTPTVAKWVDTIVAGLNAAPASLAELQAPPPADVPAPPSAPLGG